MHLEDFFKPGDLALGFGEMRLEAVLEAGIACLLDHVRQVLRDLRLGVIDILQRMHEEVVRRFNVLGEKAHCVLLSGSALQTVGPG
jgi:hypothetical protein